MPVLQPMETASLAVFFRLALVVEGDRPLLQVEGRPMQLHHPPRLPRFVVGEVRCIQAARRKVMSRPAVSSACPVISRACSKAKLVMCRDALKGEYI
jgi:hypothetical protein